MGDAPDSQLTPAEMRDLRRLAGLMIPASAEHRVPGADDARIIDDMVGSLGRDGPAVRQALRLLGESAGKTFADLDDTQAEAAAMALLQRKVPAVATLGRVVLQCYYRDARVLAALGLEARAPFPKGNVTGQGDWSLLEPVRARPRMWRDVADGGR